jgi:hypothetical protein
MAVGVGTRTAVFVGGTITGGAVSVGLVSMVFVGCTTMGAEVPVALGSEIAVALGAEVLVGISTEVLVGAVRSVPDGTGAAAEVAVGCPVDGAETLVFVATSLGGLVGMAGMGGTVPVGSSAAGLGEPVAAGDAVAAGGTKAGALTGGAACGRSDAGVDVAELPPHPPSTSKKMSNPATAISLVMAYSFNSSRSGWAML